MNWSGLHFLQEAGDVTILDRKGRCSYWNPTIDLCLNEGLLRSSGGNALGANARTRQLSNKYIELDVTLPVIQVSLLNVNLFS